MRTLGKAIRVAETQSIPWKQRLNTFLREYRSTPHSTTEASPAELMFQRKIHTKIPLLTIASDNSTDHIIRERDKAAKAKMKSNSNSHRHAKPSTLTPGDTVLCQQPKRNKLTPPYNSEPYTVRGQGLHGHSD